MNLISLNFYFSFLTCCNRIIFKSLGENRCVLFTDQRQDTPYDSGSQIFRKILLISFCRVTFIIRFLSMNSNINDLLFKFKIFPCVEYGYNASFLYDFQGE